MDPAKMINDTNKNLDKLEDWLKRAKKAMAENDFSSVHSLRKEFMFLRQQIEGDFFGVSMLQPGVR